MSDMNISAEQIQEALAAMSGGEHNAVNPALELIEVASSLDEVKNVTKLSNAELRCIVTDENGIKDTVIKNGATYQQYNKDTDVIAWLCIVNNARSILRQDSEGIHEIEAGEFRGMFGEKTGYALSYLSSFGGTNNILLDDEKVAKYERAAAYANDLIGSLDDNIKTLITGMCTNTDEFETICGTWDNAKVYGLDDPESSITWGVTAETEDQYTEFKSTYVILWARPIIGNDPSDKAPDSLVQLVTRQVNPDTVPGLAPDSSANFTVTEMLNEQIVAYASITEDTIGGKLVGIELFKTEAFDTVRTSFQK